MQASHNLNPARKVSDCACVFQTPEEWSAFFVICLHTLAGTHINSTKSHSQASPWVTYYAIKVLGKASWEQDRDQLIASFPSSRALTLRKANIEVVHLPVLEQGSLGTRLISLQLCHFLLCTPVCLELLHLPERDTQTTFVVSPSQVDNVRAHMLTFFPRNPEGPLKPANPLCPYTLLYVHIPHLLMLVHIS